MTAPVHFVRWEVIPREQWEGIFAELPSWGVTHTVAHPLWGKLERTEPGTLKQIKNWCDSAGLATPGCHAFWGKGNDIGCSDPGRHEELIKEHSTFLFQLAEMGVKTYTMHLGVDKGDGSWENVKRAVEKLLPAAEKNDIVLALENGSETPEDLQKMIDLADDFDSPFVGFCFDTGHANCYGERNVEKLLAQMAKRIAVLHLHDNYGTFDDHNPPGGGNIDWQTLVPQLKALPRLKNPETESGDWSRDSWNSFYNVWNSFRTNNK